MSVDEYEKLEDDVTEELAAVIGDLVDGEKSSFVFGIWIGQVVGDTFIKAIWSKNLLSKPYLAIANSVSALDDAEALRAKYCEVFVRDTGKTYRTTIKHIREKGEAFAYRGDRQIKLALS
jgi:hypothetical protein